MSPTSRPPIPTHAVHPVAAEVDSGAGEKHLSYDVEYLKGLGVEIDPHGKMPNVAIHYVERNWLILREGSIRANLRSGWGSA